MEPVVIYIEDVAKLIGKSPAGVRHLINRHPDSLPKHTRIGGRIAWLRDDFEKRLKEKFR